jgi:hypothetical protein
MVQDTKSPPPTDSTFISLETIDGSADVVRIDGQSFDMLSIDSIGLRTRARIHRLLKRIEALETKEDPSENDEAEYRDRLRDVAAIALPGAPDDVIAKLRVGSLADLATAFFVRAALKSPRLEMLANLTGAMSSRNSSGSTAATPSCGSTSP